MTIYELRDLIDQTGDIDNIPLRCATYSRVSTEKETQAASLHNMTDDFRDYVERHSNWTFVKAFIDDGKSGLTTKKREDFLKLLAAGAAGSYDLLITGEISRFGRNTMEGLQNIKYLKDRGIPVIFLYDDLNTYDADCDIQIQQKLVDAENESRKISKRVKRGHAKSIQKGHVLGNRIWGYKKENCKLVIDPETAPMVRRIFELYATNQHSMKEIEEILYQEGYRNSRGNRLSHTTMANIITNPKYKGYFVGGKVKVIDIFNKRQKFLPEKDWVMYKDEEGETVPALVSEELWEAANEVFQRRSIDVKHRRNCSTHKNTYTGKLFCAADGAPYYCKDVHYKGTDTSKWVCSHKIKNGADSCPSVAIYEDELNPVVLDAFREFSQSGEEILSAYLEQYRQVMQDAAGAEKDRERLQKALSAIAEKQDQILDLKVSGELTLDEFKRMMDNTRAEKAELEQELANLSNWEDLSDQMAQQCEKLKKALSFKLKDLEDGLVNRDFVDSFIQRIDVTPGGDGTLHLDIQILTSQVIHRELRKIEGRTGQTFKHVKPDVDGVRIAKLDEITYRRLLWDHRPLTDFWRVGAGTVKRLESVGLHTMGDIARCSLGKPTDYYNEDLLYQLFGVNAELLIDHAWGWEPCTIADIKAYQPESASIGAGQVLQCPYPFDKAKLVVREMADSLTLDLVDRGLVTDQLTLTMGYDIENLRDPQLRKQYQGEIQADRYGRAIPKHAHGTANLGKYTSSTKAILTAVSDLFDRIVDPHLLVRRLNLTANRVLAEQDIPAEPVAEQLDLFTDYAARQEQDAQEQAALEREKKIQTAMLDIKKKYGKNAILKGMNLEEGATAQERNRQIGGHKA